MKLITVNQTKQLFNGKVLPFNENGGLSSDGLAWIQMKSCESDEEYKLRLSRCMRKYVNDKKNRCTWDLVESTKAYQCDGCNGKVDMEGWWRCSKEGKSKFCLKCVKFPKRKIESCLGLFILPPGNSRYQLQDVISILSNKQCDVCKVTIEPMHLKLVKKWCKRGVSKLVNVCSFECEIKINVANELLLRPKSSRSGKIMREQEVQFCQKSFLELSQNPVVWGLH